VKRNIAFASVISLLPVFAVGQDKPPAAFDPAKAMAEMQQQFMQQFDANKDGKLDGQEQMMAQEAMRRHGINVGVAPGGSTMMDQFSKQFDADRDGRLSPIEAFAAQQAFQRIRNRGSGFGGVRSGGGGTALPPQNLAPVAGGNAQPDKVSPLVKRFDKDGDGKLNAAEKAAAQAELKKKDKDKDKAKDAKAKDANAKDKAKK